MLEKGLKVINFITFFLFYGYDFKPRPPYKVITIAFLRCAEQANVKLESRRNKYSACTLLLLVVGNSLITSVVIMYTSYSGLISSNA